MFDSGIGGLTTLETMLGVMPQEDFVYLADFAYAPYGTKTRDEIVARVDACADRLLQEKAKAIVVACNTATAAGVEHLRARCGVPVVGAEPALRPACTHPNVKSVLVMLTPAAAAQDKFRTLIGQFPDKQICLLTVPTLASDVERHLLDGDRLRDLTFSVLKDAPACDAVVLGCTHYVHLRPYVEQFYGGNLPVFDGNEGIAKRVQTLLQRADLVNDGGCGRVRFLTS